MCSLTFSIKWTSLDQLSRYGRRSALHYWLNTSHWCALTSVCICLFSCLSFFLKGWLTKMYLLLLNRISQNTQGSSSSYQHTRPRRSHVMSEEQKQGGGLHCCVRGWVLGHSFSPSLILQLVSLFHGHTKVTCSTSASLFLPPFLFPCHSGASTGDRSLFSFRENNVEVKEWQLCSSINGHNRQLSAEVSLLTRSNNNDI